jgi:DNA-directed RNA polymerase subunit M/transcription elongation factor TFIIS
MTDNTVCSDCGTVITTADDAENFRIPCSSCGGTKRTINVSIHEKVVVRDFLGVKAKRLGQKRPYIEDISKPSYSHSRKKNVHRHVLIDRDNDKYSEKVTDFESGEVIHQNQVPLSEHTGHGSAKFKKNPFDK